MSLQPGEGVLSGGRVRWYRVAVALGVVGALLPAVPAVAATITVSTFLDVVDAGDGVTSLREAVTAVNGAGAGIHSIVLPAGTYSLSASPIGEDGNAGGDLDLVNGSGVVVIRADGGTATIQQKVQDRVLDLHGGVDVRLDHVVVQDGHVVGHGGGIRVDGSTSNLVLENSVVRDNVSAVTGAGAAGGGGISYYSPGGRLTMTRAGVVDNVASATATGATASGGGVELLAGELVMTDSRVDGNEAVSGSQATGGGLYIVTDDAATLARSSITRNRATSSSAAGVAAAAAFWEAGAGTMVVQLTNVTIAGNTSSSPSASAVSIIMSPGASTVLDHVTIAGNETAGLDYLAGGSGSFGLSSTRSLFGGNAGGPDCNGDLFGSDGGNRGESCPSLTHPDDLPAGLPGITALVDADVPYLPITESSAALDALASSPVAEDARGLPRPVGPGADIGAFELQGPVAVDDTITVVAGESASLQPLANDDGVDGTLGSAVLATGPTKGTVTGGGAGAFTYTADGTASGTDTFTYDACLAVATTHCARATVFVTIEPPPESTVRRVAGPDRYETAAAVSADTFSSGVPVAYVATGQDFADALAGAPLAGTTGGPILLTRPDGLPEATRTELTRLAPKRIVVLGGEVAVSAGVMAALSGYTTGVVDRLSGPDRYATAAAIANEMTGATTVYLATGSNFPDALAGAAAAGRDHAPILLTRRDTLPEVTGLALDSIKPTTVVILGGTGAIASSVSDAVGARTGATIVRRFGPDRYATAAAVAGTFSAPRNVVYAATGASFPDALSGAPAAVVADGPVVLVRQDGVPSPVADVLDHLQPRTIVVLGGSAALPDTVLADLATHLR